MFYYVLEIQPVQTVKDTLDFGDLVGQKSFKKISVVVLITCRNVWNILGEMGFPGGSDGKASACNAGDPGSAPGWEDLLEEGQATHSSILAWKIPWTEEPGGLWSLGLQRVRHN